ncbi:chromosome partitioning protein ParA [Vibrio sp. IRLE0018]|uniref:chromosome partitioning protein ParA n=1 Tax=Vibrio TaxID=662 RepID=UPI0015936978|nr:MULTISPECIES: chromosome partitioning protein ParA [Vibrio]MCF8780022.1 chromosome partitioning protein ParA [Vibrio floridensis]NVC63873.1 CpsD/CapB family tyrosine-protein kinase [Vibrio sp. 05-20-BW147]HAS6349476.1 chromosome partitioning protein ParA [Vibrio vulnificus]
MTIPATHAEIEQIYLKAELEQIRTICLTGCCSGDGVTSIATALAERFILAGHNTLYVDLNLFKPAFHHVHSFEHEEQPGVLIEHNETHQVLVGLPVPQQTAIKLSYKDPANLCAAVNKWQSHYERIVIDTSPLLNLNKGNVPAQSVASACDATILVACYGTTTENQILQAQNLLSASSIHLIGTILNMKNAPSFSEELVRQLNKFRFLPLSLRKRLEIWLYRNEFLNLPY